MFRVLSAWNLPDTRPLFLFSLLPSQKNMTQRQFFLFDFILTVFDNNLVFVRLRRFLFFYGSLSALLNVRPSAGRDQPFQLCLPVRVMT